MPEKKKAEFPITPEYLQTEGGFTSFPPAPEDYSPRGTWTHKYDVYASRGTVEAGIELLGSIEMKRIAGKPEGPFRLDVVQELTSDRGVTNRVTAHIHCNEDELASPRSWRLASEHSTPSGQVSPAVDFHETVSVAPAKLTIQRGDKTLSRPVPARFTGCWNLIEAAQRLEFGAWPPMSFDLLEGLSRGKGEMEIVYDGAYSFDVEGQPLKTHRFVQMGRGILPYEYFVDEQHRVLLVITFCKAYVLKSTSQELQS
jgi:hypothetical protein